MKMKRSTIISILLLAIAISGFAQKENKLLRQGVNKYGKGDYKEAEKDFRKALELNKESVPGQFNLGTAVYKENNFDEAAKIYTNLADKNQDKALKAQVLHNLGNSYLQAKQFDKSILAYKNALVNNPKDVDTKYNLEYAKMMLKKQQQQQDKQNQDKKDDKKEEKKDQPKDQNNDKNQQKPPQDQKKISKEDAERMLEALKNDEKKTMQKVKKQKGKAQAGSIEKDW
jgi:Ca-activated chloride channel family protein